MPRNESHKTHAEDIAIAHMMGAADANAAVRAKVKRLDARIAELEAALRPFADFWHDTISEMGTVANTWVTLEIGPRTRPRWSDFRRAAAALKGDADELEGHD